MPENDVYEDEEKFWNTVNQWVRDGSNIYDATSYSTPSENGAVVWLKGTDGAVETLTLRIRN